MKRGPLAGPGWRYEYTGAGGRRALAASPMILVLQGKREGMEVEESAGQARVSVDDEAWSMLIVADQSEQAPLARRT
jgi:hypothetical protein